MSASRSERRDRQGAANQQMRRCLSAPIVGQCGTIHPRDVRSRQRPAPPRLEDGSRRHRQSQKAGRRRRGSQAGCTLAHALEAPGTLSLLVARRWAAPIATAFRNRIGQRRAKPGGQRRRKCWQALAKRKPWRRFATLAGGFHGSTRSGRVTVRSSSFPRTRSSGRSSI